MTGEGLLAPDLLIPNHCCEALFSVVAFQGQAGRGSEKPSLPMAGGETS